MIKGFILKIVLGLKKCLYFFYSNNAPRTGTYKSFQPMVFRGKGQISFGKNVSFGVLNSPHLHNTYGYIEARAKNASVTFGNNINVNNGFSVISEHKITIKDNVLIGYNCNISDSNFHDLKIDNRGKTDPEPKEVIIGKNVFIGNNVTVLKGVILGENSVVATGAVVTKSFPANVVIGGCPAQIIRGLL